MTTPTPARARRGFSLIEFMVALTISALLLVATVTALDTSFKSYTMTTEQASTQVVTRIAMHRLTTLIRTGEAFGPYPVNPITNPELESDTMEFKSVQDPDTDTYQLWALTLVEEEGELGPFILESTVTSYSAGVETGSFTKPLLTRVIDGSFRLEYDVGPRLVKATIDLTVNARTGEADTIMTSVETPAVRMVASVRPRRLD